MTALTTHIIVAGHAANDPSYLTRDAARCLAAREG